MSLFDKIRNIFSPKDGATESSHTEFEKAVNDACEEFKAKKGNFWNVNLNEVAVWTNDVKSWPDKKKVDFILWLVPVIHNYLHGKRSWSSVDPEQQRNNIRQAFLQSIFRNKLQMDDADVDNIYAAFSQYKSGDWSVFTSWPISLMLNQLEKQRKDQPLTPHLKQVLENIRKDIDSVQSYYNEKERMKMIDKIDTILFTKQNSATAIRPARFLGDDPFADFANPIIDQMPETDRLLWYRLLPLTQKATGATPSKKYLDDTLAIIKDIGSDKFKKTVHEWFRFITSLKEKEQLHSQVYNGRTYTHSTYDFLTSVNTESVKGLLWACSHFHDNATIHVVATLAERAFRKIPGKGPAAASIGNACLYVLYKSKGLDGIGQLSRLRLRIKQASAQALIDKYLQSAAEKQGVTVSEVEDMAVDDFGLVNGVRSFVIDDYTAELTIIGTGKTNTKWLRSDGTFLKSAPSIVKEKHTAKFKKIKDTAKQVEQTLTAQRDRIDRMFRSDRKIAWHSFQENYIDHGLMTYLASRIIWNFHKVDGRLVQAIRLNNQWVNASNELVSVSDTETVSLWHPVQASVKAITAWRDFFVFHQLQQPLKQAYRDVYLFTDAEANTRSYSNRMAAHILRQHQFNSLAKIRGWRYSLIGAFDNGIDSNKASLLLPEYNLRAEYWISEVNADGAMNDTGIWNYVSTDQVRFINTTNNETTDLIDIPPWVFSEVMRDVDLFVGVASVGNDPTWRDSGGLTAYRDYWTSYSFGELSEVAKNRKEIIANLLPRLAIKNVASIKDKFLVVKGKLRTYKIHIGSSNILMEPNDQYLCIVPDRSQKDHTENVFLPFEGDSVLSVVLSKAFLLADDEKITDTTIISQLNRK